MKYLRSAVLLLVLIGPISAPAGQVKEKPYLFSGEIISKNYFTETRVTVLKVRDASDCGAKEVYLGSHEFVTEGDWVTIYAIGDGVHFRAVNT